MKTLLAFLSVMTLTLTSFANQEIQIQPNSIDRYTYNFGRVWVNTSQFASYRLTNTGTTPLTFKRATISGMDYSANHNCAPILNPAERCTFTIRYSPFFVGLNTGRFILSFVEDLDIVVDLWGEGVRY